MSKKVTKTAQKRTICRFLQCKICIIAQNVVILHFDLKKRCVSCSLRTEAQWFYGGQTDAFSKDKKKLMRTDNFRGNEPEIVYSHSIKAGRRIYYVDVKKDRNADLFICITESKRTAGEPEAAPSFEKHKVFLYKEDFTHFLEGLEDAINYVKQQLGGIEDRKEWTGVPETPVSAPLEAEDGAQLDQPKRRGLFGYFK